MIYIFSEAITDSSSTGDRSKPNNIVAKCVIRVLIVLIQ
jgi:hypothetical protein